MGNVQLVRAWEHAHQSSHHETCEVHNETYGSHLGHVECYIPHDEFSYMMCSCLCRYQLTLPNNVRLTLFICCSHESHFTWHTSLLWNPFCLILLMTICVKVMWNCETCVKLWNLYETWCEIWSWWVWKLVWKSLLVLKSILALTHSHSVRGNMGSKTSQTLKVIFSCEVQDIKYKKKYKNHST